MKLTMHQSVNLPFCRVRISSSGKAYRVWHLGPYQHNSRTGRSTLKLPFKMAIAGRTRAQRHRASEKAGVRRTARLLVPAGATRRTSPVAGFRQRWEAARPLLTPPAPAPWHEPSHEERQLAAAWEGAHADRAGDPWGQPLEIPHPPARKRTAPVPAGHHRCKRRGTTTGRPCRRIVKDGGSCPHHPSW
jgi:hypothetical protein